MNSAAMINLWNFIQGMNLSHSNKRWLAERLVESENYVANTRDEICELAKKICTEQEYQKLLDDGFLDNPVQQYRQVTDEELGQYVAEADAQGYLSVERSSQFMDSLSKL